MTDPQLEEHHDMLPADLRAGSGGANVLVSLHGLQRLMKRLEEAEAASGVRKVPVSRRTAVGVSSEADGIVAMLWYRRSTGEWSTRVYDGDEVTSIDAYYKSFPAALYEVARGLYNIEVGDD